MSGCCDDPVWILHRTPEMIGRLGRFDCPCHGSKFDLAGRVFRNVPAPRNLEIPRQTFLSDAVVLAVRTTLARQNSGLRIISLLAALLLLAGCGQKPVATGIDPEDATKVARGQAVYAVSCAACHGVNLEGQPNWRSRKPDGRMPAPPHDDSGHTWHHPDEVLFGITKEGLVPGKYGPPGYVSDMPAFSGVLSDADISAALSYIQNRWSPQVRRAREEKLSDRNR